MLESVTRGELPQTADLIDAADKLKLKRGLLGMRAACTRVATQNAWCCCADILVHCPGAQRDTLPPVVTHNLVDDKEDDVLNCIRRYAAMCWTKPPYHCVLALPPA